MENIMDSLNSAYYLGMKFTMAVERSPDVIWWLKNLNSFANEPSLLYLMNSDHGSY